MAGKKVSWRLAKSLEVLRQQINSGAPKRSKASDGTIGDAAHSSRTSDHNPNSKGVVCALDITHDPLDGVNIQVLADAVVKSEDERIKYIICNGRICSGTGQKQPAWVWRPYTGSNKHTKHVHFSVKAAKADDASPWDIGSWWGEPPPKEVKVPVPVPAPTPPRPANRLPIKLDRESIKVVQQRLKDLGYTEVGAVDGLIGDFTKTAIAAFRMDNSLPPGGWLDQELVDKLMVAPKRRVDPKRENMTPGAVAARVPEANAHWWNKWLGIGVAGTTGGTAILDAVGPARGAIDQVRDLATDVPGWVWLAAVAGIALVIVVFANRGEKASVEAFRDGSRR